MIGLSNFLIHAVEQQQDGKCAGIGFQLMYSALLLWMNIVTVECSGTI
jgi:hypothetical protein